MCGLFGFSTYGHSPIHDVSQLTNALALESSVRGTDATGIAFCHAGRIQVQKEAIPAYKLTFKPPQETHALIGHTRHSTQGSEKQNYNNHPFTGRVGGTRFALAHNGVLTNDGSLRAQFHLPKSKIETDSYVAVQLIEQRTTLDLASLRHMAETVDGSFSFSILDDKNNLYLVKGDSPVSLLHFPRLQTFVFASTDEILYRSLIDTSLFEDIKAKNYEVIPITRGTILRITPDGQLDSETFQYKTYVGKSWWDYGMSGSTTAQQTFKDQYIEELKSFACYMGTEPEIVDAMLEEGFLPDEIEEYLYVGV